jgi:predicted nucleic acid-binding Zn ribbon protein
MSSPRIVCRLCIVIQCDCMEPALNCPGCKQPVESQDYFCSNCGRKIKEKPQSTTVLRQIYVYLLSILLPPFGLWPAVKYLKQKDGKSRIIGFVAVILTAISVAISIWLYFGLMDAVNKQLNQQLNNINLYR